MKRFWITLLAFGTVFLCSCGASETAYYDTAMNEAVEKSAAVISEPSKVTSADDGKNELPVADTAAETTADTTPMTNYKTYGRAADETQKVTDGIHYITFVQNTTTYTNEDNRELLVETLTTPNFYSADPELCDWVNGIIARLYDADVSYSQDLLSFAQSDMAQLGAENFYSYSHHVSMGIGRHDDTVISLLSLSTIFSGGMYPSSIQTAYNLDLTNRSVLTLEDVIWEEEVQSLTELILDSVEQKFSPLGEGALFEDYAQIIATALDYGNMTPYWYFNDDGLVVFFNQYALGPYASGIMRVLLTYEELAGVLLPEYIPQGFSGVVSDVSLTERPVEDEQVYYVDFSAGQTAYISIEGEASHVQLSEVFWADQTPVGESMLFSANRVDNKTTIAVTGDLSNSSKVYALEYSDEQGGPYVVYVQGMQVINELPKDD